jgi:hypothetical protein
MGEASHAAQPRLSGVCGESRAFRAILFSFGGALANP